MKRAIMRRAIGQVADTIREMNEAHRLMLALRISTEPRDQAAPDSFPEFLLRTSGPLRHEPPARARTRDRRRDAA